jgi:hypothetical protein
LRARRTPAALPIESRLRSAKNGIGLAVRGKLRRPAWPPLVPTAPDDEVL